MKPTRPVLSVSLMLTILAIGVVSWATAPTAAISGPERVQVGEPILLNFYGTNGDSVFFRYEPATFESAPTWIYTTTPRGQQVVSGARAVPSAPGVYVFKIIATGRAQATNRPDANAAFWSVTVSARPPPNPTPTPPPDPNPHPPDPTPPPNPNPSPAPVPITTHLNVVAQYGGSNLTQDDLKFAAVRDDPNIVSNLKALNCTWKAWEVGTLTTKGENIFDALNLTPYYQRYGALPALPAIVVYDDAGNAYDANGNKTLAAIAPPLTADGMVNLVKKLRGK